MGDAPAADGRATMSAVSARLHGLRAFTIAACVALTAVACASEGPTLVTADPDPVTATPTEDRQPGFRTDGGDTGSDEGEGSVEAGDETPIPTELPEGAATPSPQPGADGEPAAGEPTAQASPEPGIGCSAPPVASDREIEMLTDADGDGVADRLSTYLDRNGSWRLRLEAANGDVLEASLDVEREVSSLVEPLGAADLDGDGTADEVLTVVGAGAATNLIAVHTRIDCDLVAVTLDGAPITFPVGGSVVNIAGLQCEDTDANGVTNVVIAWLGTVDPSDPQRYQLQGIEYQLRGSELTQVGTRTRDAALGEADFVYGQLACDNLAF